MTQGSARVAFVTGAAYGIGRAIARRFAGGGWRVAIADVNEARGATLEAELRAAGADVLFVGCDISREEPVREAIARTIAAWSRLDVLVNNAGIEIWGAADQQTVDQWNAVLDTNLRGCWLCAKYALPHLERTRGSIVNIASVQGFACERGVAPYAASKGGVLALTRGMALDFAVVGVRVNAVCPGAVLTGMMEQFTSQVPDPQAMLDRMAAAIPMGRVGRPEDIAGPVWFLASDDAAYITGASLVADGGLLARHAL